MRSLLASAFLVCATTRPFFADSAKSRVLMDIRTSDMLKNRINGVSIVADWQPPKTWDCEDRWQPCHKSRNRTDFPEEFALQGPISHILALHEEFVDPAPVHIHNLDPPAAKLEMRARLWQHPHLL